MLPASLWSLSVPFNITLPDICETVSDVTPEVSVTNLLPASVDELSVPLRRRWKTSVSVVLLSSNKTFSSACWGLEKYCSYSKKEFGGSEESSTSSCNIKLVAPTSSSISILSPASPPFESVASSKIGNESLVGCPDSNPSTLVPPASPAAKSWSSLTKKCVKALLTWKSLSSWLTASS